MGLQEPEESEQPTQTERKSDELIDMIEEIIDNIDTDDGTEQVTDPAVPYDEPTDVIDIERVNTSVVV